MLAKQLSDLEEQLKKLKLLLKENDLDGCTKAYGQLDKDVRYVFDGKQDLSESDLEACQRFYDNFTQVTSAIIEQKKSLAKDIGAHLSTQKKLNVYKSIK
ncbi:hypothetical protein HG263_09570 [Pseudoalteromonas sp. JBTF-M23]|uniref:Flagellar protein FliT n=1 Tax=Pseudoalteromonas caenipelagi TaxID=2726988 RepID=A0A849VAW4_9GAMM|nr:hypothetical protein [Pseudoalteromonas caenipelagi]NOU50779.1 hypothetical protein [Pseudoalteromonas caenipelagi]